MKLPRFFIILFILSPIASAATLTSTPVSQPETHIQTDSHSDWWKHLGLSYFTFFDGPGLASGSFDYTPNVLGKPMDDGLRLSNFISIKYKLNPSLAIDFQMRVQLILNNAHSTDQFQTFRWQSPRIGISGRLLSGENWALTGAINTDCPYFLPQPIGGGVAARQRTTIFNPGLFANFSYTPKKSNWSINSLVMPRFFFYENRNVAEPQLSRAGFSPTLKNEFILDIAPSVNYALSPATGLRLGTELIYSKLILSSWNPFHVTLNNSDIQSDAWRLAPVPLQLGITHKFNEALNVSAFIQAFPIAAQRIRRDGFQAAFLDTTSVGMWISGTFI